MKSRLGIVADAPSRIASYSSAAPTAFAVQTPADPGQRARASRSRGSTSGRGVRPVVSAIKSRWSGRLGFQPYRRILRCPSPMPAHSFVAGVARADARRRRRRPAPRLFTVRSRQARRRAGCRAPRRHDAGPVAATIAERIVAAGDDRRRALGHQPAHPPPLLQRQRRQLAQQPLDRLRRPAWWPSIASGISHSRPMSMAARVVTVPATPTSPRAALVSRAGSAAAASARTPRPLGRGGRVGVQVALGQPHAADVEAGAVADAARAAEDELGRAAADVADQGPAATSAREQTPR